MTDTRKVIVNADISKFYSTLNDFRQSGELCDVCIRVDDKTFQCHRVVIASVSEYFYRMFTGNFKESAISNTEITLHEVDSDAFEEVLNFMYTGTVTITSENAYRLLRTSEYLRLQYIEEVCSVYIENNLPINNILEILVFAWNTRKISLIRIVAEYIAKNFIQISKMKKFLEVPSQVLHIILTHEKLRKTDDLILDFLARWVRKDLEKRKTLLSSLLVELKGVSVTSIEKLLTNEIGTNETNEIEEAECSYCDDAMDDIILTNLKKRRSLSNASLEVFIRHNSGRSLSIYNLDENDKWQFVRILDPLLYNSEYICNFKSLLIGKHWYTLMSTKKKYLFLKDYEPKHTILPFERESSYSSCYTVAATDTRMYLYNVNAKLYGKRLKTSSRFFLYDCDVNKWIVVPQTESFLDTSSSCIVSLNNLLYVFGGISEPYKFDDRSINVHRRTDRIAQFYDERQHCWFSLPRMPFSFENAAACAYKDKLYVCGEAKRITANSLVPIGSLVVFDPVAYKWTTLSNMPQLKRGHVFVPYDQKLWAIGGNVNALGVCSYDPDRNTWCEMTSLNETVGGPLKVNSDNVWIADAIVRQHF